MLQVINGCTRDLCWYVCTFYFGGHSHQDQAALVSSLKGNMSKLFEMHRPSTDAIVDDNKPLPGLFFDVAIEPANDEGKPQAGWDMSVACDEPRSYFEEHRDTITGAADFVRDCVGILVLEKFAKTIAARTEHAAPAEPSEPTIDTPSAL